MGTSRRLTNWITEADCPSLGLHFYVISKFNLLFIILHVHAKTFTVTVAQWQQTKKKGLYVTKICGFLKLVKHNSKLKKKKKQVRRKCKVLHWFTWEALF